MEECYTLKGQSLEIGLSCIFQAIGNILLCVCVCVVKENTVFIVVTKKRKQAASTQKIRTPQNLKFFCFKKFNLIF